MCTVAKRKKYSRGVRNTFAQNLNKTKQNQIIEDELDKALFLSSLTDECFEKATKQESDDFETWLFSDGE